METLFSINTKHEADRVKDQRSSKMNQILHQMFAQMQAQGHPAGPLIVGKQQTITDVDIFYSREQ